MGPLGDFSRLGIERCGSQPTRSITIFHIDYSFANKVVWTVWGPDTFILTSLTTAPFGTVVRPRVLEPVMRSSHVIIFSSTGYIYNDDFLGCFT